MPQFNLWESVTSKVTELQETISINASEAIQSATETVAKAGEVLGSTASEVVQSATETTAKVGEVIGSTASEVVQSATETVAKAGEVIGSTASEAVQSATETVAKAGEVISNTASEVVQSTTETVAKLGKTTNQVTPLRTDTTSLAKNSSFKKGNEPKILNSESSKKRDSKNLIYHLGNFWLKTWKKSRAIAYIINLILVIIIVHFGKQALENCLTYLPIYPLLIYGIYVISFILFMAMIIWSISGLLLFYEFIIFIFKIISKIPSSSNNYSRSSNYSQTVETTNSWNEAWNKSWNELRKIQITIKPNSDTTPVKGHWRNGTYVHPHQRRKRKK